MPSPVPRAAYSLLMGNPQARAQAQSRKRTLASCDGGQVDLSLTKHDVRNCGHPALGCGPVGDRSHKAGTLSLKTSEASSAVASGATSRLSRRKQLQAR